MNNPLLQFDQLPQFNLIEATHVLPALEATLSDSRTRIATLMQTPNPSWANFASIMEEIDERISRVWSPVGHLNAVKDSPQLREAYQKGMQLLTEYHSEVGQNGALFDQYKTLQRSDEFQALSAAQRKVIENSLLDFKLSGAELVDEQQARLREIKQRQSELSTHFERNVLDATQAWQKVITDPSELDGLPASALDMAAQLADDADQQGWLLNLHIPSYMAVMQHANNRQLREQMYHAYSTRASQFSDHPDFDNTTTITEILQLRDEQATLLGYSNYSEYSLVKKMARSSEQVIEFLNDLVRYAKPVAEQEMAELKEFAAADGLNDELEPWDIAYYSEKLREQRYAFNDEQIKPYFPAPQVFDGLFAVAERLFGVSFRSNQEMQVWHPDVRCFDVVRGVDQALVGQLYADLFVRKNKRGGAWMDTCVHRRKTSTGLQLPVAFLTCNFSPPVGDETALLKHSEVETLFHEFGHTLHHLLTEVDEMSVAGINSVAWDAVELPSQFLENWCWHGESLKLIAGHYQTGEDIPDELIAKMRAARNFQSGMQTLRQVEFAMFDMRLHSDFKPLEDDVQSLLDTIRQQVAINIPPASNRFQNSFGHIFAGGYAAGYYSYKWSEVLSADAFGRFAQEGLFNQNTGRDFLRSILQRGGVDDANVLFEEFRGRPPQIEPLLQQTGIL